jgi:hypothetical protein
VHVTRQGRLESRGAGAAVLEDRADPDPAIKALVRGARRWSVLDDLYRSDLVSKRQFDAANRFLDDLSRASAGTACSWALLLTARGGGYQGATESQRRAIRAVQRVRLMLGISRDTVLWWVLLDNRPPREFEDAHGLGHIGLALLWLRHALDGLDEYYHGRSSAGTTTS